MTAIPFQGVRLRTVALPNEHGGWSFCLEPILLGLLLRPSAAGAMIGIASLALFLARHPFKTAAIDWRRGKSYPRTLASRWFAILYGSVGVLALAIAWRIGGTLLFAPLAMAAPLVAIQFFHDIGNDSRAILPELAGAAAAGSIAASIAIAGGWTLIPALALWGLLVARTIPTVIYVRARVRMERGSTSERPTASNLLHALALGAGVVLAALRLVPWLGVAALALLMFRAAIGLSPLRRPARAATIGIAEVMIGVAAMLLIAGGYLAAI